MNKKGPGFIAIAGGSGSGKTTLSVMLEEKYPEIFSILHLDDYHRKPDEMQVRHEGLKNWDHPEASDWEKLLADLKRLAQGEEIIVDSKNLRHNPRYYETHTRVPIKIKRKPVFILEGYLALWHPEVRNLCDLKLFLDAPEEMRTKRRTNKSQDVKYIEKILIPMHQSYIEPTKKYADYTLDLTTMSPEKELAAVEHLLQKTKILPQQDTL